MNSAPLPAPTPAACDRTRRQLEHAWSEARLARESSSAAGEAPWLAENPELRGHLETCPGCRGQAETLRALDQVLAAGFRRWAAERAPPDDDAITALLRSKDRDPAALTSGRVRRTLGLTLWVVFFFLVLLGALSLAAVALRVLSSNH